MRPSLPSFNRKKIVSLFYFLLAFLECNQSSVKIWKVLAGEFLHQRRRVIAIRTILKGRQRTRASAWSFPKADTCWIEHTYRNHTVREFEFYRRSRMNRATFAKLLEKIGHRLVRKDTKFRKCLPPDKVLGCALYRLASDLNIQV